ncbi:hypothetical protein FKP32DRAFT_1577059, partial [Trametes sanguinea]
SPSPELEVKFWTLKHYISTTAPDCPPSIVPVSAIRCQLARGVCAATNPKLWVTTTLEQVRPSFFSLAFTLH